MEVHVGWDRFRCAAPNEFNPDVEPLKRLGASIPHEQTWMTIEEACMLMQFYGLPLRKGNSLTFSVEEEEHMGALFLYKGDMVDFTNGISINTNVTKKEAEPVFPESFNVTTSCELNVEQGEDWGAYTIMVSGECPDDDYSITLGVPEGWDGFVCISYEELNVNPLKKLGSYTPYETMWVELEEFMAFSAYMGGTVTKSNTITFSSESDEPTGAFYLYKNGMVDAGNGIFVESHVTKKEAEPVFPDVIDVTANCETVTISQEFDEDIEAISIMATGTTTEDNVTLTFNLPKGWDGLIGGIMPIGIMNSRAESEWLPIEGFRQVMEELMNMEDIVQGTEFTFPANGTVQMYQFYPY
ncbi:MAG: hypothetical protein K2K94_11520, partial [Muribaculaceae bacterium]|nr:hypothetical protein [Muribaculaceae bacterium]